MTAVPSHRYRFGRFELQPGERRLLVDGAPVALGPRALDVLVVLVQSVAANALSHSPVLVAGQTPSPVTSALADGDDVRARFLMQWCTATSC